MVAEATNIRPITDFAAYYVSDAGRVFSVRKGTVRELCPTPDRDGYPRINLYGDEVQKYPYVHQLVAEAFIGPRPSGMQICHNNGIPADNRASNLRYDTAKANQADRWLHGTRTEGEKNCMAKLTTEQVLDIIRRCQTGESQKLLACSYGVSTSLVSQIMRGKRWAHMSAQRKAA